MFSTKLTHMLDSFICYQLESGWHVTRSNQGLSLGKGKSLGTRLGFGGLRKSRFIIVPPKAGKLRGIIISYSLLEKSKSS